MMLLLLLLNQYFRTCFFVLGLIANTSKGCIILKEYGWETPFLPYNKIVNYCVPLDTSKLLKVN